MIRKRKQLIGNQEQLVNNQTQLLGQRTLTLDREFVDITDGGVSPRRLIPDGGSSPTEVSADLEVLWQTMQSWQTMFVMGKTMSRTKCPFPWLLR